MTIHALAGKLAPKSILVNIAELISAYYTLIPDVTEQTQRVTFGTSGHRGSSLQRSFNEAHIKAITQAVCDYRREAGINGTLFMGIDTHALSWPAQLTALQVLAGNQVDVCIATDFDYTPTPVISHAILNHNQKAKKKCDGIVITPSHNPPSDGGFKYNPPHGGPAESDITGIIEARANELLKD
ncbi:MAG: phosphoglucomutase, alpha-D-glucose phosphate-specific, partial [Thiohalomonadales bacterium]